MNGPRAGGPVDRAASSLVAESLLTAGLPDAPAISLRDVVGSLEGGRRLAVLDDDPTGTQAILDLPVLTGWAVEDVRWALQQDTTAFFILTNTRSLSAGDAADRTREVARACLEAARLEGVDLAFASRSDSTLRGHFPLEPEELAAVSADAGQPIDAVIISPSYLDAGRVTIDSSHWIRTPNGLQPVSSSDYAADATFGYRSSDLRDWVEEKTSGRIGRDEVERITLADLRTGGQAEVARRLGLLAGLQMIVVDALTDDDLRVLTLGILEAERGGKRFVYRVGPSFVRSRSGQVAQPPISSERLHALIGDAGPERTGGLIVVGSHVSLTTRQVERLRERCGLTAFDIDVRRVVETPEDGSYLLDLAERAAQRLRSGHVVLTTTRVVLTGSSGDDSLSISRKVSQALVDLVRAIVSREHPAFVIAKGGITSSDIATSALEIRKAWVRGTLLPGIISLWEPAAGPTAGLPYVVFAGNVGDADALADVVERFDNA